MTATSSPAAAAGAPAAPLDRKAAALWHGYLLADSNLPAPKCVTASDTLSRPNYTKIKSAEYVDSPAVLDVKADLLIRMWTGASKPLVYAGAGISTSSGICDYASNASSSLVQPKKVPLTMGMIRALRPTPAHRVLTAMERRGLVWGWLQQNHDGLAQKAGFPARKVNELHGSWLDQTRNPIIKMSGSLRGDLFAWLEQMEEAADFVFCVGSSLSGLNADRLVQTAGTRHKKRGMGHGAVILSIQQTQLDDLAALRIFSKIDDFMLVVAKKLNLSLDPKDYEYAAPALPVGPLSDEEWAAEVVEAKKRQQQAALLTPPPAAPQVSTATVKASSSVRAPSVGTKKPASSAASKPAATAAADKLPLVKVAAKKPAPPKKA